jgi:hypothetical protein
MFKPLYDVVRHDVSRNGLLRCSAENWAAKSRLSPSTGIGGVLEGCDTVLDHIMSKYIH